MSSARDRPARARETGFRWRRSRRLTLAGVLAALALAGGSGATPAGPTLTFSTFAQTDLPLSGVVWTGTSFLYLPENASQIEAADATGAGVHQFTSFAGGLGGEEVRCAVPVIAYWPDGVYCHLPDNRIYRIARDGSSITLLATLPGVASDGGLVFDSSGRFGYALLASTGGSSSEGGEIYAVRTDGRAQEIGAYPGPGGADELAIAPPKFGPASGQLLLSVDQDSVSGRVLAIDRSGKVRVVASGLGNGDNPIAVVAAPPRQPSSGQPAPGLYVGDTNSMAVYFAPASALAAFVGGVVVGSELGADFWTIKPNARGTGFVVQQAAVHLPDGNPNLEGAAYVP
ncbi:MAG TPA: hypothetical protein VMV08_08390 [Gaiellaceae bacterium]|nr:hypothetical protein [Gaiellaceae bacterium]